MVRGMKCVTLENLTAFVVYLKIIILNGVLFPVTFVELQKINFCYFTFAVKEVWVMPNFSSSYLWECIWKR